MFSFKSKARRAEAGHNEKGDEAMKKSLGLGLVGMLAMAVAATAEIETSVGVDRKSVV